jgi:hypothetical protein
MEFRRVIPRSALIWGVTQGIWVVNRRFETDGPSGDGTGKSRNVGNYQYSLCNISEERIPHLHRSGILKFRTVIKRISSDVL